MDLLSLDNELAVHLSQGGAWGQGEAGSWQGRGRVVALVLKLGGVLRRRVWPCTGGQARGPGARRLDGRFAELLLQHALQLGVPELERDDRHAPLDGVSGLTEGPAPGREHTGGDELHTCLLVTGPDPVLVARAITWGSKPSATEPRPSATEPKPKPRRVGHLLHT